MPSEQTELVIEAIREMCVSVFYELTSQILKILENSGVCFFNVMGKVNGDKVSPVLIEAKAGMVNTLNKRKKLNKQNKLSEHTKVRIRHQMHLV